MRIAFVTVVLAGVAWMLPATARAETTVCTEISALPAVISTGGTYCLKKNLSTNITSGAAITIAANNVTLDCNGRKIGAREGGLATQAIGIFSGATQNTVLENCSIRGFYKGIWIIGDFVTVQDNRLDLNTRAGIDLNGAGSLVRRNRIFDTGGSTISNGAVPFAINVTGDSDVIDNIIVGVLGTGSAVLGIYVHESDGGSVTNNRIRQLIPANGYSAVAISAGGNNNRAIVDGNYIDIFGSGAQGYGITCSSTQSLATGNRIVGSANNGNPIQGCQNAGDNRVN